MASPHQYRYQNRGHQRYSGSTISSTSSDTLVNTETTTTPTYSERDPLVSGQGSRRFQSPPPPYSPLLRCSSCGYFNLLRGAIYIGAAVCFALGLCFLPVFIKRWTTKLPVYVPPPYERIGLSGRDSPWPGSRYIITEADSTSALTYDGGGVVGMAEYQEGSTAQIWTCHESDGWLAFAHDSGVGSTVYLGYRAWPTAATLCASAHSAAFNEQFDVRGRPNGGFQLRVRNGYGLEPVGRDKGNLSRVKQSDVWWRFTKV